MSEILTPKDISEWRASLDLNSQYWEVRMLVTIDALAEALRAAHSIEQYGGVRRHQEACARVAAWLEDDDEDD